MARKQARVKRILARRSRVLSPPGVIHQQDQPRRVIERLLLLTGKRPSTHRIPILKMPACAVDAARRGQVRAISAWDARGLSIGEIETSVLQSGISLTVSTTSLFCSFPKVEMLNTGGRSWEPRPSGMGRSLLVNDSIRTGCVFLELGNVCFEQVVHVELQRPLNSKPRASPPTVLLVP
jgi:hypothetical protein